MTLGEFRKKTEQLPDSTLLGLAPDRFSNHSLLEDEAVTVGFYPGILKMRRELGELGIGK